MLGTTGYRCPSAGMTLQLAAALLAPQALQLDLQIAVPLRHAWRLACAATAPARPARLLPALPASGLTQALPGRLLPRLLLLAAGLDGAGTAAGIPTAGTPCTTGTAVDGSIAGAGVARPMGNAAAGASPVAAAAAAGAGADTASTDGASTALAWPRPCICGLRSLRRRLVLATGRPVPTDSSESTATSSFTATFAVCIACLLRIASPGRCPGPSTPTKRVDFAFGAPSLPPPP